jgi:hypothetical protein
MAPGYEKVDLSLDSVACIRRKKVNEFDSVMPDRKYMNIIVCPVLSDVQKSFVSMQPGFCVLALLNGFNPSNAELNPISHLLALLGAHHILHVSRIGVNRFLLSTTAINIVTQYIK